ncbi:recombinase family protein [Billgrantia kenyensis]|uniref:Recombinase family protein n=1 Tax=Billgrantia kenyensis TaxID=321266 RepID=A0A7W0ACP7_9GAMM|nr:recombinase family protein [Halomonas kenyensis]MBA2777774.1 recombinase family protein [Halomonas kenyensis]MCG6661245.1 recombinase family protein [Halomonas kenyensis]
MIIGYARVSTQDQNPQLQRDALEEAGCEQVFEERVTGTKRERPELQACLRALRDGDTLVVWKLDRLARSLKDLVELIHELNERGVGFRSLTEAIDTTSAGGKLVFHIFGALAEFEHSLIRERTLEREGLAKAANHPKLEQLLAECDPDAPELEELRSWQDAPSVGREV